MSATVLWQRRALVHAINCTWIIPACWMVAVWLGIPFQLWIFAFAVLASLLSLGFRNVPARLVPSIGVLIILTQPWTGVGIAQLMLGAPIALSAALTGDNPQSSTFRTVFRMGLGIWAVVGIARAISGTPPLWGVAPFALLFVPLAILGLASAAETASAQMSKVGTAAAVTLAAATAALGLAGVGPALRAVRLPALPPWFGRALGGLIGPLVNFAAKALGIPSRTVPPRRVNPPPSSTQPTTPHTHSQRLPAHRIAPAHMPLLLIVAVCSVLIAAGVWLVIRRLRKSRAKRTSVVAAVDFEAFTREATFLTRYRARFDEGSGARASVRRTVRRYLLRHPELRTSMTARRLAREHGWPLELLAAYEWARYEFRQEISPEGAKEFVRRFREFVRSKG